MKRFIISALALLLVAVILLAAFSIICDRSLIISKADKSAVCDGLVGANTVQITLGTYDPDGGTTATLSDEALQAQIDAYNAQVDRYYAMDNTCRSAYKEQNESILLETSADEATYNVDGGVLDYEVHRLTMNRAKTEAMVNMSAAVCHKVVETEDHSYGVQCSVENVELTAVMVKEENTWKLLRYDTFDESGDEWALQSTSSGTEYADFADALAAAEQLNAAEFCPVSVN
jgi:hypothetical protein